MGGVGFVMLLVWSSVGKVMVARMMIGRDNDDGDE